MFSPTSIFFCTRVEGGWGTFTFLSEKNRCCSDNVFFGSILCFVAQITGSVNRPIMICPKPNLIETEFWTIETYPKRNSSLNGVLWTKGHWGKTEQAIFLLLVKFLSLQTGIRLIASSSRHCVCIVQIFLPRPPLHSFSNRIPPNKSSMSEQDRNCTHRLHYFSQLSIFFCFIICFCLHPTCLYRPPHQRPHSHILPESRRI